MIPVQIGPKAVVPVDPPGATPPEKGSDADAFGFESQVLAETDQARGDGGWLPIVLFTDGSRTEGRESKTDAAQTDLREVSTRLAHLPAEGGASAHPVTAGLAGPVDPDVEGSALVVLPPNNPGQGAPAAWSVFPTEVAQLAPVSNALVTSTGKNTEGALAFAVPGGNADAPRPPPCEVPSSPLLDVQSQQVTDDLPELRDEAPNLPHRSPIALSPSAPLTDLSHFDLRSALPAKMEAYLSEGAEAEPIPRPMPVVGAIEGAVRDALSRSEATVSAEDPGVHAVSIVKDAERSISIETHSRVHGSRGSGADLDDRELAAGQNANAAPAVGNVPGLVDPAAFQGLDTEGLLLPDAGSPVDSSQDATDQRGSPAKGPMPMVAGNPSPVSLANTILGAVVSHGVEGVEVALSPAELGHLRIELSQVGDGLRIVVSAERSETLDLLRRHADQLMAEVLDAGFSGAEMSFGTWGGPSDGGNRPHHQDDLADTGPEAPTVSDAAMGRFPILPAHHGGLNLRL